MCHINYTLSVMTRITHQPSVCSKTLRQVAVDAFCWTQGPSSILITNHTCIAMKNTKNVFFFSFKSCRTNCLCYCVMDLLRCPSLLPPLLTKRINYVTWETASDANCYSVIFFFFFFNTALVHQSHTLFNSDSFKESKKKTKTTKQSESHFFRCLWVYPLLLGNQEKWMTVRMWGQTVLIPPSRRDEAESGDVLLAEMNYSCGIGLWYPRWHFSALPLCSHFLCSGKKKVQRIEGEKGCVVQNGPSREHFQRKYEILQLQKAI